MQQIIVAKSYHVFRLVFLDLYGIFTRREISRLITQFFIAPRQGEHNKKGLENGRKFFDSWNVLTMPIHNRLHDVRLNVWLYNRNWQAI